MDHWGRRPAAIWGGFSMGLCMLIIGSLYASGSSKTTAGKWTIISLIYIFIIIFSITWAVVLKVCALLTSPVALGLIRCLAVQRRGPATSHSGGGRDLVPEFELDRQHMRRSNHANVLGQVSVWPILHVRSLSQ